MGGKGLITIIIVISQLANMGKKHPYIGISLKTNKINWPSEIVILVNKKEKLVLISKKRHLTMKPEYRQSFVMLLVVPF